MSTLLPRLLAFAQVNYATKFGRARLLHKFFTLWRSADIMELMAGRHDMGGVITASWQGYKSSAAWIGPPIWAEGAAA